MVKLGEMGYSDFGQNIYLAKRGLEYNKGNISDSLVFSIMEEIERKKEKLEAKK